MIHTFCAEKNKTYLIENILLQECLRKDATNIVFNISNEIVSNSYFKIILNAYFLLFSYVKVFFVYDSIILPNKLCPQ